MDCARTATESRRAVKPRDGRRRTQPHALQSGDTFVRHLIGIWSAALHATAFASGVPAGRLAAQVEPWRQYASPEAAGFSPAQLAAVGRYADSLGSGALMVVYRGHVLAAWGDVAREFQAHSVRKSLVSALYGATVGEGRIDLEATLADLGIDDTTPLTAVEKTARVRDLLAARSGVYLPAAYAPPDQDEERPVRGSHRPGTHWFYNNWDFNVAGVIYERVTGENLYDAFRRRIAAPIGMEDFDTSDGFLAYEPSLSRYPAHTFRMSTRDLARVGLLYLQEGRWRGRQVVPADWVRKSTTPLSDLGNGAGYGYMWWTYGRTSSPSRYPAINRYQRLFQARGTGGQAVFVIPEAELVIVHRGDTDHGRSVAGSRIWDMVERIVAARTGQPEPQARLVPLSPTPLASQLPAPAPLRLVQLDHTTIDYLGTYEFSPGRGARVFLFAGRLFLSMPSRGEAELFALSPTEFTIRVLSGVRVTFEKNDRGAVAGLTVQLGPERMRGTKVP